MTGGVDPATVVGIGLAVLLGLGAALWKTGALRGDINREWASRVNAATSALTDRTIDELNALRRETDRLLGSPDAEDPPVLASVDPTPLVRRATTAADYHKARRKLNGHFQRLLKIAPLLIPAVVLLGISDIALCLYFAKIAHVRSLLVGGLGSLGIGSIAGGLLFAAYLITEHRLAGAELLAQSNPTIGQ